MTPTPTHWPYVSLRLDIRWLPNVAPYREPAVWIALAGGSNQRGNPGAGGTGCAQPGHPEVFFRLSALVYSRLELAVAKLLTRRDPIEGGVHAGAAAAAHEAQRLMQPLHAFLAERYTAAFTENGGTAEEAAAALTADLADGRRGGSAGTGSTQLPRPLEPVGFVERVAALTAERGERGKSGAEQFVESWRNHD